MDICYLEVDCAHSLALLLCTVSETLILSIFHPHFATNAHGHLNCCCFLCWIN